MHGPVVRPPMITLDILATLPKTRREVLAVLKMRGRATILELSRQLDLTHEGIRSHILQLQRDGWIMSDCEQVEEEDPEQGAGRPPAQYCLTDAGDHVFPKYYDELTLLLLDAAAAQADGEVLRRILEKMTDMRVKALADRVKALAIGEQIASLRSIYIENDPFTEVAEQGGDWVLIERNCPFLNVALQRPTICSTTVSTLRRLLGHEVVRQRRFQDGEGRCEFRVVTSRPRRRGPRFEIEPPREFLKT